MSARLSLVLTALLVASAGSAQEPTQCDDYNLWVGVGAAVPVAHVCEVRELRCPQRQRYPWTPVRTAASA